MKIAIKNLQKRITLSPLRIKKAVLKALSLEKKIKSAQINLFLVSEARIRGLNRKFLRKDSATDVICFDLSLEKQQILADIFISTDAAVKNSRIYRTRPDYEAYLYAVHGILHLLGYRDNTAGARDRMQKKAEEILLCLSKEAKG